MSEFVSDDIIEMARGLMDLYKDYLKILKPEVAYVIKNNVRDTKYLERLLDQVINVPTDEGYELLVILCDYISTFDKELADDYLKIYNELYGEDEVTDNKTI